jgi:hypothetical protein
VEVAFGKLDVRQAELVEAASGEAGMGRRQVDAAEAHLGKARGEIGEVEALAEAELEHRLRRLVGQDAEIRSSCP